MSKQLTITVEDGTAYLEYEGVNHASGYGDTDEEALGALIYAMFQSVHFGDHRRMLTEDELGWSHEGPIPHISIHAMRTGAVVTLLEDGTWSAAPGVAIGFMPGLKAPFYTFQDLVKEIGDMSDSERREMYFENMPDVQWQQYRNGAVATNKEFGESLPSSHLELIANGIEQSGL